ncbi:DNA polymerase III subunit beta [Helicobacter canis]|uniref:Beta sliding clamp n=1 Tax=Helicobacter canis TaxID=29419 RepID=A0A377J2F6_9HELI|nr:DNA polymerase III subunit beta [Helicobacter canis]STO96661.1 DNA polymerase III subunit beta [Helicobacter canis]
MKITLNKNNFEIVLNNFQSFLDKKDSSQITSHIYLETLDNKLLLKATDYEISIQSKIDIIQKIEDGIATIEGKKILSIIKPLDDGEITLETKEGQILIKQKNKYNKEDKFELPTFNATEFNNATKFPEINESDTQINLNPVDFIESIKKVAIATDATRADTLRVELTGILLDVKDYHCNFVGTDTRRLAIIRQNTQSIGSQFSIIIPRRAIMEISKLFYDEFEIYINKRLESDPTMLFIKSQNYIFSTKLISGKYPDYEKIIPKEFKIQSKLPKDDVIKAIKKVNSLSTNIKGTLDSSGLIFETINSESSESATTPIDIALNIAEPITLGMNSRYVLDFLGFVGSNEFEILINDSNMPFMLKDDKYSTIIMPVLC